MYARDYQNELARMLGAVINPDGSMSGSMGPSDTYAAPNILARLVNGSMVDQVPQPDFQMPAPYQGDLPPMNSMRDEQTGKVTSLDFRGGQPMQMGGQQGGQPMKLAGYGNGTLTDLGVDNTGTSNAIDYGRGPVDIPGMGKGYYTKDGRSAIVNGTKVILGYDDAASRQRDAQNLAMAKTKAEIANMQEGRFQLTPDGLVLNTKTGEVSPPAGNAATGQVARKQQEATYNAGLKDIAEGDKSTAAVNDLEYNLKRFGELNNNVTTGRIMGHLPAIMSPDRQELERIQNYLSMNNFKPGQGSMSNFERSLIQGAGPNVTNDKEANDNIIKVMLGGVQNLKDKQFFKEAYLQAKGTTLGADQAWQQYLDNNPRYVQGQGGLMENPKRVDWQTYFAGGGQSAQPASGGGVPAVRSQADYDALPKGATYVGPDGKQRRKQ